jgi:hypothetical protein
MPYKSDAQRRWAHTKAGKEALGGEAGVHEWDEATKGKNLPERVSKSMPNPTKTAIPSIRMPKPKAMAGAFDKPSKFFKSENVHPKHPSVRKLWDFIQQRQRR